MPEKNRFHILVVEDDDGVRRNLVVGLKDAGFKVSCEVDGEAGVQRALKEDFDLVILDLMMPERDGFEVLEAWNGRLSIPFIILSARTELRSRLKSFESYGDARTGNNVLFYSHRRNTKTVNDILREEVRDYWFVYG